MAWLEIFLWPSFWWKYEVGKTMKWEEEEDNFLVGSYPNNRHVINMVIPFFNGQMTCGPKCILLLLLLFLLLLGGVVHFRSKSSNRGSWSLHLQWEMQCDLLSSIWRLMEQFVQVEQGQRWDCADKDVCNDCGTLDEVLTSLYRVKGENLGFPRKITALRWFYF